ncbi:MAG: hypothetical protein RI958_1994 [Actinomycetota bacterium]
MSGVEDRTGATRGQIEFRVLRTADELAVLPPFEHLVWGSGGDAVSVNMLVAVVIEGGVAIGAFAGDRVVGSVFGFPTREPDVLHSHYLAVDPAWRQRGLGVALKHRQRTWCLEHGYRAMRWTYDPLQLTNAHLNLRVLGAVGISYHVDHYGTLGGINGDLPSDRVTVRWDLESSASAGPYTLPTSMPTSMPTGAVAVVVPAVSAADIGASTATALGARLAVRRDLAPLLAEGWRLVDVDRAARSYVVAPPAGHP